MSVIFIKPNITNNKLPQVAFLSAQHVTPSVLRPLNQKGKNSSLTGKKEKKKGFYFSYTTFFTEMLGHCYRLHPEQKGVKMTVNANHLLLCSKGAAPHFNRARSSHRLTDPRCPNMVSIVRPFSKYCLNISDTSCDSRTVEN